MLPSLESERALQSEGGGTGLIPAGQRFAPSCVHVEPERVNIQAVPVYAVAMAAPISAMVAVR